MSVLNESVYLSESQCPRLEKKGFGLDSGPGPRDPNVSPLYYENMWRKRLSPVLICEGCLHMQHVRPIPWAIAFCSFNL